MNGRLTKIGWRQLCHGPVRCFLWTVPPSVFLVALVVALMPIPSGLLEPPPVQTELVDRHGCSLRTIRPDERPFGTIARSGEIPRLLMEATLAAEDQRYWSHWGIDGRGIARALWELCRYRRIVSGGSTITQQLIKLAQPRPRAFRAKLVEALQALRLERMWSKDRILTEYLNRLDYGNLTTGCAGAARFYFGKPLRDLSVAECAFLAALPQAPSRLNPLRHFERARGRQQWILEQMRQCGYLTASELDRASREQLCLVAARRAFAAPHFVDLVLQRAMSETESCGRQGQPFDNLNRSRVWTSLDLELNRFVEGTVHSQLGRLHSEHVQDGAAVVLENRTGGVMALVGSPDYFARRDGQVNGAWAPRSAGSSLKPFTYLIAFEQGISPATVVADVPTEFSTATGVFAPVNYDRHCHGPIRCREALANSLNIPAVKVLAEIGGAEVLQSRLQRCGLTTLNADPSHYGLGLTLGNAEVRLLELANAYACLARLGIYQPYALATARSASRPGISDLAGERIFEQSASFLIADILSDNAARSQSFGVVSSLRFNFPVACKTGTSSDFRDNWAFAFTPEFTVGVWVGNFDGSPMHEISGVTGAAPILHEIVEHLHSRYGTSWYFQPKDIEERQVHRITGHRLIAQNQENPLMCTEKFVRGHLPPLESRSDYDSSGRVRLSQEYQDWWSTSDNLLREIAILDGGKGPFRISFPLPGTRFVLDADLPDHGRRITLRAEGAENTQWESPTLTVVEDGKTRALLSSGKHTLKARNLADGTVRETWVDVVVR